MKKLLLLLVLAVPLTQSCDFFQKKDMFSNNQDSLLLYQKKKDSLRYMDSIQSLRNKLSSLKRRNQRLLDSIKGESARKRSAASKYHIIVGSFKNPEYLNSYNSYVQEKGFKTKILQNEYGFSMIAVESFDSWSRAVRTLEELKESFEKTAWIYAER